MKQFILFSICIFILSNLSIAQTKDEAYVKKLTTEFESKKLQLNLPLRTGKIDNKTLYLDENRKPLRGVDIIAKDSSEVYSPANGFVTAIFPDDEKYFTVIVCHGDYFLVYTHIEKTKVLAMQNVKVGDLIGIAPIDKQGNRRMHIEIWHDADKLWPPDWFKKI